MTARMPASMSRADAAALHERARAHQRSLSAEIRAAVQAHVADPLVDDEDVLGLLSGDERVIHHIACPPALLEELYDTADRAGRSPIVEVRIAVRRHLGLATTSPSQPRLIAN